MKIHIWQVPHWANLSLEWQRQMRRMMIIKWFGRVMSELSARCYGSSRRTITPALRAQESLLRIGGAWVEFQTVRFIQRREGWLSREKDLWCRSTEVRKHWSQNEAQDSLWWEYMVSFEEVVKSEIGKVV